MRGRAKNFDETRWMSFLIEGAYDKICENIRNLVKKVFDSEPVHDKKVFKSSNKILWW